MLNRYAFLCTLLAVLMLSSCTEVDMFDTTTQSHDSDIRFTFDWANQPNIPDSMAIMAVRVVNHMKRGMMLKTTGSPLLGHYFYNPPKDVVAWVDPNNLPPPPTPHTNNNEIIDPTEENNGGSDPSVFNPPVETEQPPVDKLSICVDRFSLPNGTYKFYAIGMSDTDEHSFTNIKQYLHATGTGTQYSDVEVIYNTHEFGKGGFVNLLIRDFNRGFGIVSPDYPPIYAQCLDLQDITANSEPTITLTPKPLTQNIDISLVIDKDLSKNPFKIEQILGEISGIPSKASVFDGHLYLAKTNKMQFHTTLTDENGDMGDTYTNKQVTMHANINVLSILHSDKPTDLTGPGILQVAILYSRPGEKGIRLASVKINLHNTLKKANLITYSEDYQYATKSSDHAVLDIKTRIPLSANGLTATSGTGGGIDEWMSMGNVTIDDGEGIELY